MKSFVLLIGLVFCALSPGAFADGYFGYDAQGGNSTTMGPSYCWGNKYSVDWITPSEDIVIDTLIIWCNGQNNYPKVVFGIYTVSGGVISNLVAVSDTISITGNTMQRWSMTANIILASGSTYTICLDIVGSAGPSVAYASQSAALSRYNGAMFPSTWSDNASVACRYSVAAHFYDQTTGAGIRRRATIGGGK